MKRSANAFALATFAVFLLIAVGCGDSTTSDGPSEMDRMAQRLDAANDAAKEESQPQAPSRPAPSQPADSTPPAESSTAPPAQPDQTSAQSGDQSSGPAEEQSGGYLSSIAMAHRSIRTRVDDLAWKQAVSHYKAINGHTPRTHEEFMTGVIEGFDIPLPELEPDEKYVYEPDEGQFGELYVVRQRRQ